MVFDDGSHNTVTEEYVYSVLEPIPQRVKDKIKELKVYKYKTSLDQPVK